MRAKCPRLKRLEDLDLRPLPGLPATLLAALSAGSWIDRGEPVVQLSRVVGRYERLDLLCLDELGYVHLDPLAAPDAARQQHHPLTPTECSFVERLTKR